jgi:hypothetical protein
MYLYSSNNCGSSSHRDPLISTRAPNPTILPRGQNQQNQRFGRSRKHKISNSKQPQPQQPAAIAWGRIIKSTNL